MDDIYRFRFVKGNDPKLVKKRINLNKKIVKKLRGIAADERSDEPLLMEDEDKNMKYMSFAQDKLLPQQKMDTAQDLIDLKTDRNVLQLSSSQRVNPMPDLLMGENPKVSLVSRGAKSLIDRDNDSREKHNKLLELHQEKKKVEHQRKMEEYERKKKVISDLPTASSVASDFVENLLKPKPPSPKPKVDEKLKDLQERQIDEFQQRVYGDIDTHPVLLRKQLEKTEVEFKKRNPFVDEMKEFEKQISKKVDEDLIEPTPVSVVNFPTNLDDEEEKEEIDEERITKFKKEEMKMKKETEEKRKYDEELEKIINSDNFKEMPENQKDDILNEYYNVYKNVFDIKGARASRRKILRFMKAKYDRSSVFANKYTAEPFYSGFYFFDENNNLKTYKFVQSTRKETLSDLGQVENEKIKKTIRVMIRLSQRLGIMSGFPEIFKEDQYIAGTHILRIYQKLKGKGKKVGKIVDLENKMNNYLREKRKKQKGSGAGVGAGCGCANEYKLENKDIEDYFITLAGSIHNGNKSKEIFNQVNIVSDEMLRRKMINKNHHKNLMKSIDKINKKK